MAEKANTVRAWLLLAALCVLTGCGHSSNDPSTQVNPATATSPAATASPSLLVLDLGHQIVLELVPIKHGTIDVGGPDDPSEYQRNVVPNRRVTITTDFSLGANEVTVEQFTAFVNDTNYRTDAEKNGFAYGYVGGTFARHAGNSWRNTGFKQGPDHPVVDVSWNDAQAFCAWLSRRTGRDVRLPTEAQWEYACRAGTTTEYPWGADPASAKDNANVFDQAALREFGGAPGDPSPENLPTWNDGRIYTAPVGSFRPNAFGLHDMIGNCAEWCADYYASYPRDPQFDPPGPATGTDRVIRGGSWKDLLQYCRSASRSFGAPDDACDWVGFRVCVMPGR